MEIGVDFGTTRTIVAAVDRGNYPVISFTDAEGDSHDHVPSLVALTDQGLRYGFDAHTAGLAGAPVLRSLKRHLASAWVRPDTTVTLGGQEFGVLDLVTGFLAHLLTALRTASNLDGWGDDPPATMVAVPAHAHSAQRFLTLEAFRRAGFDVRGLVNEPSAAGFEYTHRQRRTVSSRRTKVLVYDLGGGTFDASLITVDDAAHHVIASRGRHDLGGDDVDRAIADLVLAELDAEASGVDAALLEQCRLAKEMITPQTRRITVEHDDTPVTVPIERVRDAVAPLVEQTLETMAPLVDGTADSLDDLAGIYLVGGGSGLPIVPRLLRERFGRRVHRSPHPAASTAIGLAIAADPGSGYSLTDRTGREVGVFREGAAGDRIVFEPLLHPDTVPGGAPVVHGYRAAHDIGWFRYAERAGGVAPGRDTELIPIGEVRMPFRPELQHLDETELAGLPVTRTHTGPRVEESCTVGEDGLVTVTITDLDSGHTRTVELRGGSPVS